MGISLQAFSTENSTEGYHAVTMMLDTLRHVETPEGIQLSLPIAGPVSRARAWVLDMLIIAAILVAASIVLGLLGTTGWGLFALLTFGLSWMYPVFFEVLRKGQTPGKKMVGLRVVHDDGMPIGWSGSMIRSIIGFVDMLPLGYAAGLITTLLNHDAKRLGDLAAGTIVVHTSQTKTRGLATNVAPIQPSVPLLIDEQHGLVEFAARASQLAQGRLDELARIAGPLTETVPKGSSRVHRLLAQARWISGDR
jgi:uncharacterized RDD family membrane protein YckC